MYIAQFKQQSKSPTQQLNLNLLQTITRYCKGGSFCHCGFVGAALGSKRLAIGFRRMLSLPIAAFQYQHFRFVQFYILSFAITYKMKKNEHVFMQLLFDPLGIGQLFMFSFHMTACSWRLSFHFNLMCVSAYKSKRTKGTKKEIKQNIKRSCERKWQWAHKIRPRVCKHI